MSELILKDLNPTIRRLMVHEVVQDQNNNTFYLSPRLNERGKIRYPKHFLDTATDRTPEWLIETIKQEELLNLTEFRKRPNTDDSFEVKVPINAAEVLVYGEFNRYFMRGLSIFALQEKQEELFIYRAKAVSSPRADSEAKIGTKIKASQLLYDLRKNISSETALGLNPGPGSGLSVCLSL